jgi:hypothetical protein
MPSDAVSYGNGTSVRRITYTTEGLEEPAQMSEITPLTVAELIAELQEHPGNLPVYLHFHDDGEECLGVSRGVQGSPLRDVVWI